MCTYSGTPLFQFSNACLVSPSLFIYKSFYGICVVCFIVQVSQNRPHVLVFFRSIVTVVGQMNPISIFLKKFHSHETFCFQFVLSILLRCHIVNYLLIRFRVIISGAILFVLFVSYLGSKGHRPRWIALGSTVMGAGSIVFILPHILAEQYDYRAVGKVYPMS